VILKTFAPNSSVSSCSVNVYEGLVLECPAHQLRDSGCRGGAIIGARPPTFVKFQYFYCINPPPQLQICGAALEWVDWVPIPLDPSGYTFNSFTLNLLTLSELLPFPNLFLKFSFYRWCPKCKNTKDSTNTTCSSNYSIGFLPIPTIRNLRQIFIPPYIITDIFKPSTLTW